MLIKVTLTRFRWIIAIYLGVHFVCIRDVTIMMSSPRNFSVCAQLHSVQNLYFGFFIFWKLTELCYFVTYLSNDPRSSPLNFLESSVQSICTGKCFSYHNNSARRKDSSNSMSETVPDSVAEPSVRQVSVDAATIINNKWSKLSDKKMHFHPSLWRMDSSILATLVTSAPTDGQTDHRNY